MHILVFGDSEAYGAFGKQGGWVARLRRYADEKSNYGQKYYCLVYNMSISGDTSAGVLKRFDAETKLRLDDEKDDLFIISIGANDSMFIHSKKDTQVLLKDFRKNIQSIINKARKYSGKIAFIGLLPADESKVDPIPWHKIGSYKNKYIKQFNGALKEVCSKNNVLFIDNYEKWTKTDYKKLLIDGVHPNTAGHKKLYETVKNFLEKENLI